MIVTTPEGLVLVASIDWLAAALLLLVWTVMTRLVERPPFGGPTTHQLMEAQRRRWFAEVAMREMRMLDGQLLANLRGGAAFFASASMLAIGGLVALVAQTDQLALVAQDLTGGQPDHRVIWEAKLLFVLFIVASALLKFVWSHRLFGYVAILLGAIPAPGAPDVDVMATRTAEVMNNAARSFNRGVRTLYFALAAMTWLISPYVLMLATLATFAMLIRREFRSDSRKALL